MKFIFDTLKCIGDKCNKYNLIGVLHIEHCVMQAAQLPIKNACICIYIPTNNVLISAINKKKVFKKIVFYIFLKIKIEQICIF